MGHVITIRVLCRQFGKRLADRKGFTLVEMIGVIAIIGVLAAALVPNAVKAIDRAAVKAEVRTLATLADGLRTHLIENKALPALASWTSALATYTDENAAALATNSRSVDRVLIYDPQSTPPERALILSSMRNGLTLPSSSDINTATRFQALWDTTDGELPSTVSWSFWSSWAAVDDSANYLVIERVNLRSIYLGELKTCTVALNNTTDVTASYEVYDRDGARLANAVLGAGATATVANLAKGDRVLVYSDASYSSLVYSYIAIGVDTSFDLSAWIASSGPVNNGNGNGNNGKGHGNGHGNGNG